MRLVIQLKNKQSDPELVFVGTDSDAQKKFNELKSDDVYATAIYTLGTPLRVYYGKSVPVVESAEPKEEKIEKKAVKKTVKKVSKK
jgi:hypothetical protein